MVRGNRRRKIGASTREEAGCEECEKEACREEGHEEGGEVTDQAAKSEKSVHEMTVEDILNSDTYVTASALKKGFNGVYVVEVYKGRAAPLEKTDADCVIRLSNPDMEILEKDCVDIVEIITRELGNLPG